MKKEYSILISVASLLLSVIAVCVSVWRSPELSFDYQGVLVGVLSLLVTVLVGFQIYNSVDVNRKMNEIETVSRNIARMESSKSIHATKSYFHTHEGIENYRGHFVTIAIDEFMIALQEGVLSEDNDMLEKPYYYLDTIMRENKNGYPILKGEKDKYISILSSVPIYKDGMGKLIRFISISEETDYPNDGLNWKPKN